MKRKRYPKEQIVGVLHGYGAGGMEVSGTRRLYELEAENGRRLGRRRHRATAGYAHRADAHLVEAAKRVGNVITEAMHGPCNAFAGGLQGRFRGF